MKRRPDKNSGSDGSGTENPKAKQSSLKSSVQGALTQEDFILWQAFTKDITPYKNTALTFEPGPPLPSAGPSVSRSEVPQNTYRPVSAGKPESPVHPPQLDARTEQRLKRGQIPIEGTLDLHGMTQDQAHTLLNEFVLRASKQGKRCILVITGKGLGRGSFEEVYAPDNKGGILRQKLPLWLGLPPIKGLILRITPAIPRHGGGGAWYIYLKRERQDL